jgi:CBS domain-containing protein
VIVLHDDDTLAGIITKTDLVAAFLIHGTTGTELSKYMTSKVITVGPTEPLFTIERLMINNKISRIVVEKNKKPIGIVTYRDFFQIKTPHWIQEYHETDDLDKIRNSPRPNASDVNRLDYVLKSKAESIMTSNPIVIKKNECIFNAALLMIHHKISGLPIVDKGILVGIITKSDIVNAIDDG